ncbi:MED6 mediator sub complex component-domain-containing protein [Podospora didyma]|uniref:Mediator of RNA polymerase II transcription subunit 6 n=1 Tax=Podospora didyma TaxID=330526 RepID=A0AAE0ND52_9PEZI|nr:MED6 mediator sub complex component-domain-containing protein [Podospora didyma]
MAPEPLDEIQWSDTTQEFEAGIHNNSVLYYFAKSPFFDKTSNNEVVYQQGCNNPNMAHYLTTREMFEGRLRSMSGLEYMVAQEPADTSPGAGTGVWVINKQTRRKRQGEEDDVTVHATYFMIGANVYMAPSLADILSSKIAAMSSAIAKILPTADNVQDWTPALGRVYHLPSTQTGAVKHREHHDDNSKEATPMPDTIGSGGKTGASSAAKVSALPDPLLVEDALHIHDRYGGEYMDENPITGKPGEFHLSSTGRKEKLGAPKNVPPLALKHALPALNTKVGDNPLAKSGKETKSPKTPGPQKPKRRKSKVATPGA